MAQLYRHLTGSADDDVEYKVTFNRRNRTNAPTFVKSMILCNTSASRVTFEVYLREYTSRNVVAATYYLLKNIAIDPGVTVNAFADLGDVHYSPRYNIYIKIDGGITNTLDLTLSYE